MAKPDVIRQRITIGFFTLAMLTMTPASSTQAFRASSIADAIRMTEVVDPESGGVSPGGYLKSKIAVFSPDAKRFVILTSKGVIAKNQNSYLLLLYDTDRALYSPSPKIIASFSSSSNQPGIDEVRWLNNHELTFLAENPGETHQLYALNCDTLKLEKLSRHATNIVDYAMTDDMRTIVYAAEAAPQSLVTAEVARRGMVVRDQFLGDLMNRTSVRRDLELFATSGGGHKEIRLSIRGMLFYLPPWLAPNGRYLVANTYASELPKSWNEYKNGDSEFQFTLKHQYPELSPSIHQYELIDVHSGKSRLLLNAPLGMHLQSGAAWSSDSTSIVVSGTFLSLDIPDPQERALRSSNIFVAEVNVNTGKIIPVTARGDVAVIQWDSKTGKLLLSPLGYANEKAALQRSAVFQKSGNGWVDIGVAKELSLNNNARIAVGLEEDMNTPPKVIATDRKTLKKAILLDPNPQFADIRFGHVQNITFKATDGRVVNAGMYLPPDYVSGRRYPLVIQTHGWDPNRFWIDGPYSTGFAAQALAGKEIVILQLDDDNGKYWEAPGEVPQAAAALEGAIDYADRGGLLIDRKHVGVIAFSRTGLGVEWALTHSRYHFAAASLDDISDPGYFRYLFWLNTPTGNSVDNEQINGGPPFGTGLTAWLKNSPDFNLDKVTTPVLLQANEPASLNFEWEWFVGLSRLGKPVDFIYMPDADHVLVKPWDRLTSQQGNVDWFDFWLNGHEDPNPAKAAQYKRWELLRKLQQQ